MSVERFLYLFLNFLFNPKNRCFTFEIHQEKCIDLVLCCCSYHIPTYKLAIGNKRSNWRFFFDLLKFYIVTRLNKSFLNAIFLFSRYPMQSHLTLLECYSLQYSFLVLSYYTNFFLNHFIIFLLNNFHVNCFEIMKFVKLVVNTNEKKNSI